MVCRIDNYVRRALEAAKELALLADEGDVTDDDGCAVLCGVIRDCAYKIRRRAELERDRHRTLGLWEDQ